MKRTLFFLMLIVCTHKLWAQNHIQWSTNEATPHMQANLFKALATDKNGNTYTIDFTQSDINFYVTYRFFCYDANGVKKWQYDNDSCFTSCNDWYYNVVPVDNGGAIFIGVYEGLSGNAQVRIKRIGLNGNLMWQQYWNSPFMATKIAAAALDHSGKLVIAFNGAFKNSSTQEDFALAKFDTANGSNTWHVEIPDGGTVQPLSENFTSMDIDANDNIYTCGTSYNPFTGAGTASYLFRINPSGSVVYRQQLTTINQFAQGSMHIDPAGNVYLLGMDNTGIGGTDVVVEQRVAATGQFSWNTLLTHDTATLDPVDFKTVGGETFVLFNHHYFVPDTTFSGGHNTNLHYTVARLAYNGVVRWKKDYFTHFDDNAPQTGSGGAAQLLSCNNHLYVLSGLPFDDTTNYLLLHKIDTAGNTIWYDSTKEDFGIGAMASDNNCNVYVSRSARLGHTTLGKLVQKFSDNTVSGIGNINRNEAFTIYPNPVTDEVHISLPESLQARKTVAVLTDNLGRNIVVQEIDRRDATIQMKQLANGVYYLSVIADGKRTGTKVIVKE